MIAFKTFSPKQKFLLTWWANEKTKKFDAIICDGSIRSGKTLCMALSFICWACCCFNDEKFAICGKTIDCVKRNVLLDLVSELNKIGFLCNFKISKNYFDVSFKNKKNRFFIFGGNNASSCNLVQGITLAGVLFDEVSLMPKTFVEQTLARCSVLGSKFWFNCNPKHPNHWFYRNWIQKLKEKNAIRLHFTLHDNPALSNEIIQRYEKLYSGVFFDRFIKGEWAATNGQVYSMFEIEKHVVKTLPKNLTNFVVSIDYGIVNPTSFGLWGKHDDTWFRIKEFYYDSKKTGAFLTDEELYLKLEKLTKGFEIDLVVVDPSASSFIECVRRHKCFKVIKSQNDVLLGINLVCEALKNKKILIHETCKNSIEEFFSYCWDENKNFDKVKKENDHAMDEIRYFVSTVLNLENFKKNNFFVLNSTRLL